MAGADAALPPKLLSSLHVPVIVGPTGIGKSELAFRLALELDGEIVVADSKQVYQRLDIATNKPSPEHRALVPYHMVDFIDPAQGFNAAQFVQAARHVAERPSWKGAPCSTSTRSAMVSASPACHRTQRCEPSSKDSMSLHCARCCFRSTLIPESSCRTPF